MAAGVGASLADFGPGYRAQITAGGAMVCRNARESTLLVSAPVDSYFRNHDRSCDHIDWPTKKADEMRPLVSVRPHGRCFSTVFVIVCSPLFLPSPILCLCLCVRLAYISTCGAVTLSVSPDLGRSPGAGLVRATGPDNPVPRRQSGPSAGPGRLATSSRAVR